MIRTQAALGELTHEQAYIQGWQDHADSLEDAADHESALQASRFGRRLDEPVDRMYAIAPWPLERAEAEPEAPAVAEHRAYPAVQVAPGSVSAPLYAVFDGEAA